MSTSSYYSTLFHVYIHNNQFQDKCPEQQPSRIVIPFGTLFKKQFFSDYNQECALSESYIQKNQLISFVKRLENLVLLLDAKALNNLLIICMKWHNQSYRNVIHFMYFLLSFNQLDLNVLVDHQEPVLYHAIRGNHMDIIDLLIDSGAQLSVVSKYIFEQVLTINIPIKYNHSFTNIPFFEDSEILYLLKQYSENEFIQSHHYYSVEYVPILSLLATLYYGLELLNRLFLQQQHEIIEIYFELGQYVLNGLDLIIIDYCIPSDLQYIYYSWKMSIHIIKRKFGFVDHLQQLRNYYFNYLYYFNLIQ